MAQYRSKKPIQLWLTAEAIEALKNQAWADHIPVAEYCRRLIQNHLDSITEPRVIKVPSPREKGDANNLSSNATRMRMTVAEPSIGQPQASSELPVMGLLHESPESVLPKQPREDAENMLLSAIRERKVNRPKEDEAEEAGGNRIDVLRVGFQK